jgi:ABC-type dipeptide/oligopeptide/nickel transport system permease subunit
MVVAVGLLACYVRLWFSTGPHDVVSSDGATPPSLEYWLGIDPLGRDALVRLSAAIGGSLFVAAVAATIAVLLGFGWVLVAVRVPRGLARPTLAVLDLLAVPAVVWIALPGGRDLPTLGFAGDRFTLALALSLIAMPFVARVLWRRCEFMLRSQNTPVRPAGALAGLWLAAAAAGLLAEHLATFLLIRLDERAPTLGAFLARTVFERDQPIPGPDAMTTWPWLWYPPAIATTVLVAGFALLATAALKPRR